MNRANLVKISNPVKLKHRTKVDRYGEREGKREAPCPKSMGFTQTATALGFQSGSSDADWGWPEGGSGFSLCISYPRPLSVPFRQCVHASILPTNGSRRTQTLPWCHLLSPGFTQVSPVHQTLAPHSCSILVPNPPSHQCG